VLILRVLAAGAALLLFAYVAIENLEQTVQLSFFGRAVGPYHVFVLLIAALMIGALGAIVLMSIRALRLRRELGRAARRIAELEREIDDLRTEPVQSLS